jgi:hypothetical protein
MRDVATGKSAYQITVALNKECVASPRRGKSNQSTIRDDPKKHGRILHNPLDWGKLGWAGENGDAILCQTSVNIGTACPNKANGLPWKCRTSGSSTRN